MDSAKIYAGILLIETNIIVAHGRFLSIFYLQDQDFKLNKKHFTFSHYIV